MGLVTLAGPAAALGAWTAPEVASRGPLPVRTPEVAVNARGDAAAVWVRGAGRAAMIVASLRPAGGAWSAPQGISRRGRPAIDPAVTVDAQGRVLVAWRQVVRTRRVPSDGRPRRQAVYVARVRERVVSEPRWGAIATLSSRRQKVGPPELDAADDGRAVATWHWGTGNSPTDAGYVGQVQIAERDAAGDWSSPRRVSRSPLCRQVRLPRVAVGPAGHAVVWWQCDLPGDTATALGVSRSGQEAFGDEHELPFRTEGSVAADLGITAAGRAVAVSADGADRLTWWRGDVDEALSLDSLAVLSAAVVVDRDAGDPRLGVAPGGDALSAWADALGHARAVPIAGDLGVGAPAMVGVVGQPARDTRAAAADGRRGGAAWVADGRVVASVRSADGTLPTGEPVSEPGIPGSEAPSLAMDGGGEAVLVWVRTSGARTVVERATWTPAQSASRSTARTSTR